MSDNKKPEFTKEQEMILKEARKYHDNLSDNIMNGVAGNPAIIRMSKEYCEENFPEKLGTNEKLFNWIRRFASEAEIINYFERPRDTRRISGISRESRGYGTVCSVFFYLLNCQQLNDQFVRINSELGIGGKGCVINVVTKKFYIKISYSGNINGFSDIEIVKLAEYRRASGFGRY